MKVVVIGDVSWKGQYHLGDEAMTESAISQLRKRGAEVVLVAGTLDTSSSFYGVECVPIFEFAQEKSRAKREARIKGILAAAKGERPIQARDKATIDAVLSADAVVIAGGGNLNSSGPHHIYERLALKRLAAHARIPLFVSSQTVGPHLLPFDRNLVVEIAKYATVFGAREPGTAAMLREICGNAARIVHTLDDALLLDATEDSEAVCSELQITEPFVVGSFTFHPGNTGLTDEAYYRELGEMLDEVVDRMDSDVVLIPHMGVLGVEKQEGTANDVFGHDRIVHYSRSGRIRSLPMISARDALAVTSHARFTISTRYHPVVFGGAVGVPAIGLVMSFYSAQRMRGALKGFGAESFAIPFESWRAPFGPKMMDALESDPDRFAQHFREQGLVQREYQSRWWDGIAGSIQGTGKPFSEDVVYPHEMRWESPQVADLLAVARAGQEPFNKYRLNNLVTVRGHSDRLVQLEKALRDAQNEIKTLHTEVEELRHRQRPPGATLRDSLRAKLRNLRGR